MYRHHVQFAASPHHNVISISVLLVVVFQAICHADDRVELHHSNRLCGEFRIGKEGRLILLPVQLNGREYHFMVDTGACRSGFDISLRDVLGEPRGTQVLQTPAGRKRVETYACPEATLDGQPLRPEGFVVGVDLTEMRQASNEKIFGIIGIDILRNCIAQIDFDRGIIRFLDSLPKGRNELGERIPIEITDDGVPFLVGVLAEDKQERFLIDTGAQGNSLHPQVFDEMAERNYIRLGSSFTSITVGGELKGSRGVLRSLSLGPIAHEGLRVARLNPSSLGLRYFSRFLVTFDFPDHAVYLRNGPSFSKVEPAATSGMSLVWIDGNVVVKAVKSSGPAERAGVRSNDLILRVNGKEILEYDHFSLRQLLTSGAGKKVPMQIRRVGREINVELILDED